MTSTNVKAVWQEGDACLAPCPEEGTLREGTILKLFSAPHTVTTALVRYTGHCNVSDQGEEMEEKEEIVPISELQGPSTDCFERERSTQEKPLFHSSSLSTPGSSEPLILSQTGDKVPYTINRYLRDYQREGIQFIYHSYVQSRGCILGDDMGLGKTIQVIGFLAALLHKTGTGEDIENNRPQFLLTQATSKNCRPKKAFLIVAPLSVLYNWKDELETWGHFQVVVVHGLHKEEELTRVRRGRSEIALTTYETLRLGLDQFNSIDWCAVIVDEAHKIKNPNSQITHAMKRLRCQVRVGLTGTILQNNLDELWCVMDWAIPGCLGSLGHFKNKFSDPIEQGQKHTATKRSLATGRKAVRALARKLSHWFLRRTKALISQQLPKKDDRVVYCSLTEFQQAVYRTVLESEDVSLLLRSSEKCSCGSGRTRRKCCYKVNRDGVEVSSLYFSYLAILRKVANHVALLQSTADTSSKQKKYVNAICEKVFQKFPDFIQRCKHESFEAMSDPMYSGKMKALQKLLKHYMQRKDKVLLFSMSTKLLNVLESYCMAEGLDYSRLDGNTKARDRMTVVKNFNSRPDINICLVSTMAGGLGLNFVGANVVVLFDPTWNPANDLQAIDRAYRIGQCRDVTVLRLISLGTVEEIIYLRQIYKQQLQCSVVGRESARRYFEAVQGAGNQKGELFGVNNLFRLQTQGTCLTRQILEREGQVEVGVMTAKTQIREEREEAEEERRESGPGGTAGGPSEPRGGGAGPSGAVLDFSSCSEDDDAEAGKRRTAPQPRAGEDGGTPPGKRSLLLQHDFSRLPPGPEVEGGAGSSVSDGSLSEEGEQVEGRGCEAVRGGAGRKEGRKGEDGDEDSTWDVSSGSGREDGGSGRIEKAGKAQTPRSLSEESDDLGGKTGGPSGPKPGMKRVRLSSSGRDGLVKAKTTVPRMQPIEFHSDESEDLGSETRKEPVLQNEATRSRHTEDIETFTSSEEETSPIKRRRSSACLASSPPRDQPRTHRRAHTPRADGREDGPGPSRRTARPSVSFTSLRHKDGHRTTPGDQGAPDGTIDHVLGGLQEVVFTHSNQRVVGGSKAEERISRAALRDVFVRKVHSQLPANQVPDSQGESQWDEPSPPSPPFGVRDDAAHRPRGEGRTPDHPVTHTARSTHPTPRATFIVGETPAAVRRQQLEAMATACGAESALKFADEVLRRTSAQRLSQLRHYYSSQGSQLAAVVRENYPEPESARPKPEETSRPSTSSSSSLKHRKSSKRSHKGDKTPHYAVPEYSREVLTPEAEEEEKCHEAKGEKKVQRRDLGSQTLRTAASSSSPFQPKGSGALGLGESDTDLDPRDRPPPSSQVAREAEAVNVQRPATPPCWKVLTELIGDTSILDDLFRTKPRTTEQRRPHESPTTRAVTVVTPQRAPPPLSQADPKPPSPPVGSPLSHTPSTPSPGRTSRPVAPPSHAVAAPRRPRERSTGSRKDFWDILSEGNEESINRLTDLAEVERVCGRTKVPAEARRGEQRGSAALWKSNDRFLWKK
ncbi:DNA excision repair protein ERCC-6-like 2 [Osmerus eperlanus]|uniref:DNA excision repair protein ERCC-6-like 2 n=1 Tax=Osmerus eperlanus TaxID=29151 RepID=UPI002E108363